MARQGQVPRQGETPGRENSSRRGTQKGKAEYFASRLPCLIEELLALHSAWHTEMIGASHILVLRSATVLLTLVM